MENTTHTVATATPPWLTVKETIEYYKFRIFRGKLWALIEKRWRCIDDDGFYDTTRKHAFLKGLIRDANGYHYNKKGDQVQHSLDSVFARVHKDCVIDEQFRGIVFLNGYVDADGWHPTADVPFTTTQIPVEYDPGLEVTDKNLIKLMDKISGGDAEWLASFLRLSATMLSNENWEVFGILYGDTSIGKGWWVGMITDLIGNGNLNKINSTSVFGEGSSYQFAMRGIDSKSLVFLDELPDSMSSHSSETIKMIADKADMAYDSKGSNATSTPNTATWVAATNHLPTFHRVDEALKQRAILFEFKNKTEDITQDEWYELSENRLALGLSLLPAMVDEYVKLHTIRKNRGLKFATGDSASMWEDNEENDIVGMWVKNNVSNLINHTAAEALTFYSMQQNTDKSLPKLGMKALASVIVNSKRLKKSKKLIDGTRRNVYVEV